MCAWLFAHNEDRIFLVWFLSSFLEVDTCRIVCVCCESGETYVWSLMSSSAYSHLFVLLGSYSLRKVNAEVLLLLTDVDGLYDKPPSEYGARIINTYARGDTEHRFGDKSSQGRGGMGAKVG